MNERIGIVSLGCAKNQVDAEMMLFTLRQCGYKIVADPAMADCYCKHLRLYRVCQAGKHKRNY